jgi:hypothetical protein
MKHAGKGLLGRFIGNAAVFFSAFFLLFPSNPSVICMAPGSHVAIEDLNALCCAHSKINIQDGCSPSDALNTAKDCQNCTDIIISINERGPISESNRATAGFLSDAGFEVRPPEIVPARLFRRNSLAIFNASVFSSVPLRC